MNDALGILLLTLYIVGILAISASVTFAVVKIFPTERNPKKPDKPEPPSSGDTREGAGRLFRRAKRETA